MTTQYVLIILSGLPWTLALTASSLLIGALLGFPLMYARSMGNGVLRYAAIVLFAIVRGVPPIVWLFIIFFGVGNALVQIGPFVASVVTFSLIAATNIAEIYRGGMLSIHHGQHEAAAALNFAAWDGFRDVLFPQMLRVSLPSIAGYAIGLLKDSAVASTIGVLELAYQGRYVTEATYKGLTVLAIVAAIYIVVSIPIAVLARVADARMRRRVAR